MAGEFNIGSSIKMVGTDWKAFQNFLGFKWKAAGEKEVDKATGRAALYIKSQIRARILSKSYAPNSLFTARRKGYKSASDAIPLVDTGGLIREALQTRKKQTMMWEVGIIGDKPSRTSGYPASAYVRALHEGVTITRNIQGVNRTFRIPPRPFLRAVWEDMAVQSRVHKEWNDAITKVLKKYGKL